jgi:hypothetical protein
MAAPSLLRLRLVLASPSRRVAVCSFLRGLHRQWAMDYTVKFPGPAWYTTWPSLSSPMNFQILAAPATSVSLLPGTTSNEDIYARQCDLSSPESIRAFCGDYYN